MGKRVFSFHRLISCVCPSAATLSWSSSSRSYFKLDAKIKEGKGFGLFTKLSAVSCAQVRFDMSQTFLWEVSEALSPAGWSWRTQHARCTLWPPACLRTRRQVSVVSYSLINRTLCEIGYRETFYFLFFCPIYQGIV